MSNIPSLGAKPLAMRLNQVRCLCNRRTFAEERGRISVAERIHPKHCCVGNRRHVLAEIECSLQYHLLQDDRMVTLTNMIRWYPTLRQSILWWYRCLVEDEVVCFLLWRLASPWIRLWSRGKGYCRRRPMGFMSLHLKIEGTRNSYLVYNTSKWVYITLKSQDWYLDFPNRRNRIPESPEPAIGVFQPT